MRRICLILPRFVLISLCLFGFTACSQQPTKTELGTSLSNWHNIYSYGDAEIVDNEIHLISTKNWFYLTKVRYSDFELEAEILMPDVKEYSNSGFIFRAQVGENEKGRYAYGYQAEVDPSARKWSGGLYDQGTERKWLHPTHPVRSKPDEHFRKNLSGEWDDTKANAYKHLEWNKYKVRAVGPEIKIWVNGILTTHVIDTTRSEGHIGIQHHGSKALIADGDRTNIVRFRNIQVKEL